MEACGSEPVGKEFSLAGGVFGGTNRMLACEKEDADSDAPETLNWLLVESTVTSDRETDRETGTDLVFAS